MADFDFSAAEVVADPYPMFEATRHLSPLRLAHPGPGEVWSVLTFDHVNQVLRDHDRFSSAGFGDFGSELFRLVLINDDPPRHTRLPRAVNGSFSRRSIASLSPRVEALDEVIRPLLDPDSASGGFSEAEALGYAILLLVAGTESTAYSLGNAVSMLAGNPDLWSQLRDAPELLDEFIEETLRLESPVQLLPLLSRFSPRQVRGAARAPSPVAEMPPDRARGPFSAPRVGSGLLRLPVAPTPFVSAG